MLGKIIAYVENLIVHRLSNNRTFQRFAVRMDDTIQTKKKYIQENISKTTANGNEAGNSNSFNPVNLYRNFVAEVQKEMINIKNASPNSQRPAK